MGVKYICEAYSENKKEISNYGYLLENNEGIPIIIIEPISGLGYTKVIYLNEDYELDAKTFGEACRYYLELSNNEFYHCSGTVRLNRTTKEEFIKNMKYISGINAILGYKYPKMERIESTKATRKRIPEWNK